MCWAKTAYQRRYGRDRPGESKRISGGSAEAKLRLVFQNVRHNSELAARQTVQELVKRANEPLVPLHLYVLRKNGADEWILFGWLLRGWRLHLGVNPVLIVSDY